MSLLNGQIRNLTTAASDLLKRANEEQNQEAIHHAQQIKWILEEAIQPWFLEIDEHFDGILQITPEVQSLDENMLGDKE